MGAHLLQNIRIPPMYKKFFRSAEKIIMGILLFKILELVANDGTKFQNMQYMMENVLQKTVFREPGKFLRSPMVSEMWFYGILWGFSSKLLSK